MVFCSNCGNNCGPNAQFCGSCGTKIESSGGYSSSSSAPNTSKGSNQYDLLFFCVLFLSLSLIENSNSIYLFTKWYFLLYQISSWKHGTRRQHRRRTCTSVWTQTFRC